MARCEWFGAAVGSSVFMYRCCQSDAVRLMMTLYPLRPAEGAGEREEALTSSGFVCPTQN